MNLSKIHKNLREINQTNILDFKRYLSNNLKFSESSVDRKLSSLNQFIKWAEHKGYLKNSVDVTKLRGDFEYKPLAKNLSATNLNVKVIKKSHFKLPLLPIPMSKFITWSIFTIAILVLGIELNQQLFINVPKPVAYPAEPVRPSRFLSFQGKLTDKLGNPINTPKQVTFKLWDQTTGGNELYNTGSCSISADQNGVFATLIGSTCGQEIPNSVFSENSAVFIGITVLGDSEATPRQPLTNIAYSLNSETLQGLPPSSPAQSSTIPFIDKDGQLQIAVDSPKILSSAGTFTIEGQSLTLQTSPSSGGNINLTPDSSGALNINFNGAAPSNGKGFINAEAPNLSTGALYYGQVNSGIGGFNLLDLRSGPNLTNHFYVDSAANLYLTGNLNVGGSLTTTPTSVNITAPLNITGLINDGGLGIFGTSGNKIPATFDYTKDINIDFNFKTGATNISIKGDINAQDPSKYYLFTWGIDNSFNIQKCKAGTCSVLSSTQVSFDQNEWHHGLISFSGGTIRWILDNSKANLTAAVSTDVPRDSSGGLQFLSGLSAINDLKISPSQNTLLAGYNGQIGNNLNVGGNIGAQNLSVAYQLQTGQASSAPTALGTGALYFNTSNNTLYYWNSSQWIPASSGPNGTSLFWENNNCSGPNSWCGLIYPYLDPSSQSFALGGTSTSSAAIYFNPVANNNSWFNVTGGNLGIGTTSPRNKLDIVANSSATSSAFIENTNTASAITGLTMKLDSSTLNGTSHFINFENSVGTIIGSIQGNSNGTGITYSQNGIADFGEYMPADPSYLGTNNSDKDKNFPPGTIVCEGKNGIKPCALSDQNSLMGVISDSTSFLGGNNSPDSVIVGMIGQIRVKIDSNSPHVQKGDLIAISNNGLGMRAYQKGYIVGKAVEEWQNGSGIDKIIVYVNPSWYDPNADLLSSLNQSINGIGSSFITYITNLKSTLINTQQIIAQTANIVSAQIDNLSTNNLLITTKLVSPLVETGDFIATGTAQISYLQTSFISPLSDSGDINIKLGNQNSTSSASQNFGRLNINDTNNQTVTSIDSAGNITTQGNLQAQNATFSGTLTSNGAVLGQSATSSTDSGLPVLTVNGNASVSGTLYADQIITKQGKFGDLLKESSSTATYVTNIYNVTQVISPTPTPNNLQPTTYNIPSITPSPTPITQPTPQLTPTDYATSSAYLDSGSSLYHRLSDIIASSSSLIAQNTPTNSPDSLTLNKSVPLIPDGQLPNLTSPLPQRLNTLTVQDELNVIGQTSLANTTVSGTFMVDGGIVLEYNKISTTADTLYISSLNTLSFMGGEITMDKTGNLTVAGTINALAGIATSNIAPLPGQDLTFNLNNNPSNSSPSTSGFGNILVKGQNGQVVTSIDSSGNINTQGSLTAQSGNFAGSLRIGSLSLPADFNATVSGNVRLMGSPDNNGQMVASVNTSGTTGLGIIPAGQTQLILYNPQITSKSLIYLSPLSTTGGQNLYVSAELPTNYFKVSIDRPYSQDIKFNWWIVEGK